MTERKNRVQPGGVLAIGSGVQVYEIASSVRTWADPGSIDLVTAAFSRSLVAVRTVGGPLSESDGVHVSQIVLSREDFDTLIASYRAFVRAEKKACADEARTSPDDFDPFDDLP